MGSVTPPRKRPTWADLSAAGATVSVSASAARVMVGGIISAATAAREEITWRRAAMVSSYTLGRRAALVVFVGIRPNGRQCLSCCDEMPAGDAGDCQLCLAARVLALRDVGVLTGRPPALAETEAGRELPTRRPQAPLAFTPPAPWRCKGCKVEQHGLYPDPDLECGRCELQRISVCDTSRLGG